MVRLSPVRWLQSQLLLKQATNRQQNRPLPIRSTLLQQLEVHSLSRSTLSPTRSTLLPIRSTLSPVCIGLYGDLSQWYCRGRRKCTTGQILCQSCTDQFVLNNTHRRISTSIFGENFLCMEFNTLADFEITRSNIPEIEMWRKFCNRHQIVPLRSNTIY